jgi:signal recognition particle subunit SRP54
VIIRIYTINLYDFSRKKTTLLENSHQYAAPDGALRGPSSPFADASPQPDSRKGLTHPRGRSIFTLGSSVREKAVLNALNDRFSDIFQKIKGWGSLNEKNIQEGLRDIRRALLEADVNYKVVKTFIEGASREALGEKVLRSVTPLQQFTKIVNDYLVDILGGEFEDLHVSGGGLSVVMLCGLQGSGKTTTAVKLGKYLEKTFNKKPYFVAADVYRPAAVEQLTLLAGRSGYPVFHAEGRDPVTQCVEGVKEAKRGGFGAVIIDTAGRLEIDEEMMKELQEIKRAVSPAEVLLVADAATGQSAVTVAGAFNEKLGVTGIVLSRMDSDARGGAALSMSHVTGRRVKFIGTGEKVGDLERFHPQRIAGRILDRGDIVTLVEKVQEDVDLREAKKLEQKIRKNTFDLEDFLGQLKQIRKMGSLESVLGMLPGVPKKKMNLSLDDDQIRHTEAIILSMTPHERSHHKMINGSRRKRIALGSGTSVYEVNRLLSSFEQMKKMMKKIGKGGGISNLSSLTQHLR